MEFSDEMCPTVNLSLSLTSSSLLSFLIFLSLSRESFASFRDVKLLLNETEVYFATTYFFFFYIILSNVKITTENNRSPQGLLKIFLTRCMSFDFFYWLLIYVIFLKGSWLKGYITGSPFFLRWQLPLDLRTPRKVNGQGSTTRITLRIGSLSHFSSSSSSSRRGDSAALGSGSRHSLASSPSAVAAPPSPSPLLLSSVSSTKPKREAESSCFNPSRVLFRHSSAGRGVDRSDSGEVISFNFMRII